MSDAAKASEKRCNVCGQVFPRTAEFFYRASKANPSKLDDRCKVCRCASSRASQQRRKQMNNGVKAEQKRCVSCEMCFPATADHFYVKGENKNGTTRLDYVCRPCRVEINAAREFKRKELQAAELVGPPRPTQRPGRPLTIKPEAPPEPARCPVPRWVQMRSAWRGPVPQGYGVAA